MKEEQIRMCNAHGIPIIKSEKAKEIIEKREPVGFFIEETDYGFTGIDNSDGEAITEDFKTFDDCISWLLGGDVKECYVCGDECNKLYRYNGLYYCAGCLLQLLETFYINRYELVKRLRERTKSYAEKMVQIENNDIDFLNNRGYINLTAACLELQTLISLIEIRLI